MPGAPSVAGGPGHTAPSSWPRPGAAAGGGSGGKPTVVLVHGAFAEIRQAAKATR